LTSLKASKEMNNLNERGHAAVNGNKQDMLVLTDSGGNCILILALIWVTQ